MMKEEIMYNILWIDDEHENLSGFLGRASVNGINLIPFKSLNGGMEELEKNYPFYDGVLLDAQIFENEDDEPLRISHISERSETKICTSTHDSSIDSAPTFDAFREVWKMTCPL